MGFLSKVANFATGGGSSLGGALIGGVLGGLGSKTPGQISQTTTPFAGEYLKDLYGQAQDLTQAQQPLVAGFTQPQQQAQQLAQQYATGGLQQLSGQAQEGLGFVLDPAQLDPASNPYLASAAQAAVNPIFQQLQQQVLPGIASGASQTGNVGSSRQGVAEGLAIGQAAQGAQDVTSQMYSQAYQQGIQNLLGATAQAPGIGQFGLAPAQALSNVGAQQQAQQQAELMEPYQRLQLYQGLLQGPAGGTVTQTAPQASPATSTLGGALLGAGIQREYF